MFNNWKKKPRSHIFRDDPALVFRVVDNVFIQIRAFSKSDPEMAGRLADAMHNVGKWMTGSDRFFNAESIDQHLAWFDKKYPQYDGIMARLISRSREQLK